MSDWPDSGPWATPESVVGPTHRDHVGWAESREVPAEKIDTLLPMCEERALPSQQSHSRAPRRASPPAPDGRLRGPRSPRVGLRGWGAPRVDLPGRISPRGSLRIGAPRVDLPSGVSPGGSPRADLPGRDSPGGSLWVGLPRVDLPWCISSAGAPQVGPGNDLRCSFVAAPGEDERAGRLAEHYGASASQRLLAAHHPAAQHRAAVPPAR